MFILNNYTYYFVNFNVIYPLDYSGYTVGGTNIHKYPLILNKIIKFKEENCLSFFATYFYLSMVGGTICKFYSEWGVGGYLYNLVLQPWLLL
jgi:hypothetical protein